MSTIISHKHKFIFCHVPRTGGTSFTEAVKPFLGPDDELDTWPKHTPLSNMSNPNCRTGKVFKDYTKVSIFRYDEDRLESLKRLKPPEGVKPNDDFWWENVKWLYDKNGDLLADILISFYSLPDSAIEFLQKYGIEVEDYPHLNRGR